MINKATHQQAYSIANLHHQTINQGFLPKIGSSFLQSLYRFLIAKELVLVYKEEDEVRAFISCALWLRRNLHGKN